MANYAILKAAIADAIKQNGNNEITGNLLQQQLLAMVNSLGVGYKYAGIATPATDPGTPDQNVFYIASTAGIYSNFNSIELLDGEIAILKYNGAWTKDLTGAASKETVDKLIGNIIGFSNEYGLYIVDSGLNVLASFTNDGFDTAKIGTRILSLIFKNAMGFCVENGIFYVDENMNIGGQFTNAGFRGTGIIGYREIHT